MLSLSGDKNEDLSRFFRRFPGGQFQRPSKLLISIGFSGLA
jgi:hypothetical protein